MAIIWQIHRESLFVHGVTEHEACFVLQLGHLKFINIKSIPIQTTIKAMTVHGILSTDACYNPNAGKGRI